MKRKLRQLLWIVTGAAVLLLGLSKKAWAEKTPVSKGRVETEQR